MAATAKKPAAAELLSISEIAKRVNLDRATVRSRLADLGYDPDPSSTPKNQLYPFDENMVHALKAAKDSLSAARIRDLRVSSQLKEFKLAEMRNEFIPAGDVVELSQKLHHAVHKEIAVSWPQRLAARLAKAKTAPEVKKILKVEAEKFLKRLRDED